MVFTHIKLLFCSKPWNLAFSHLNLQLSIHRVVANYICLLFYALWAIHSESREKL